MQSEKKDATAVRTIEKKAYQTPQLITHGSIATLTQNSGGGDASGLTITPDVIPHHRHRWWDCL